MSKKQSNPMPPKGIKRPLPPPSPPPKRYIDEDIHLIRDLKKLFRRG